MRSVAVAATLLGLLASCPSRPASAADPACRLDVYTSDKVALVVGTDDYSVYQTDTVKSLENAVHDAQTVAAMLSKQGFEVRCLLNPTKLSFDDEKIALEQYLLRRTRENPAAADMGRAVIYVAGHGYRDPTPGNGGDYLLFPFDPDPDKYSGVVDLNTHGGRIAQGRFSIQSLIDAFNATNHGIILILDACRSLLDVGAGATAGPAGTVLNARLVGRQVVLYSTQPGGVAADSVPDSPDQNGLYASILSRFMSLSLRSFIKAITLTQTLVKLNNTAQAPINVAGTETVFLAFPWFDDEVSEVCDIMDTDIWNSAGKSCSLFAEPACIKIDICKAVKPLLNGPVAVQAKACLARYKARWLHKDLVDICSPPVVTAIAQPGPATAPAPSAGVANPADPNAYNVVTIAQSNPSAVQFDNVALSGWADKTPSLFAAGKLISPEQLASIQGSLDNQLATLNNLTAKRTFTTAQREILVTRIDGGVPPHTAPSPFGIDATGHTITLRNLPSGNAGSIATFAGDGVSAEIDCYTIPCTNDWIGMRVVKDKSIFRGWVSADELTTLAKPAVSIDVRYDGKRIVPRAESIEAIRRAIRPNARTAPSPGRVQVMAVRSIAEDSASAFLAGARLSFLDGLLIDLGVSPDDIIKTVADAPSMSKLPAAVINLGPPFLQQAPR